MRRAACIVKSLAPPTHIWHRSSMSEDSDIKAKQRSDRLREALRANLRRRKAMNDKGVVTGPSSPKPAD